MIFELFRWWYGAGWQKMIHNITVGPVSVERNFSVAILLETLFAPWKRMITVSGKALDARIQAMLDNLVSRCVGFFVRLFVLIAAALSIAGTFVAAVAVAAAWPLVPALIVYCAVRGITG
ncbi:MAG TPA: hypothetical protein VJR27_03500 [Candidatus Saccharimonadales bacterium]|nr:hypothetical protein [Candidatus Saccharimonadales bacterium]